MNSAKTVTTRAATAILIGSLTLICVGLGGCTTSPKSETDRAALSASGRGTLATFKAKDPSLGPLMKKAVGWAVFPNVGKGGFLLGGTYGKGEVFERGKLIGYADVSEISAGLQVGAQNFSQILLFLRQTDLDRFKQGNWTVSGNVSAVALSAGAAGTTDPSKGVIALVDAKGGLMAEAAVGGQRYRFVPLN